MCDLHRLFERLARSKFRSRFRLGAQEVDYMGSRGLDTILEHAEKFIRERLSPAQPRNDGKQTPMRGHPVFIAQHATATCCRGCLAKWHGIAKNSSLTEQEIQYIGIDMIVRRSRYRGVIPITLILLLSMAVGCSGDAMGPPDAPTTSAAESPVPPDYDPAPSLAEPETESIPAVEPAPEFEPAPAADPTEDVIPEETTAPPATTSSTLSTESFADSLDTQLAALDGRDLGSA